MSRKYVPCTNQMYYHEHMADYLKTIFDCCKKNNHENKIQTIEAYQCCYCADIVN